MKSPPPALPAVVALPRPTGVAAARPPSTRLGEPPSLALARPVASTVTVRRGGQLGSYVDTYA